tara:strand:+ start:13030 stop:14166 length:1137 start_codon:yes stop_codon:yes gene_type:complete
MDNIQIVNDPRKVTITNDTPINNEDNIKVVRNKQFSPRPTARLSSLAGLDLLSNPKKQNGNSSGSDAGSDMGSNHDFTINSDLDDDEDNEDGEGDDDDDDNMLGGDNNDDHFKNNIAESVASDESSEAEIPKTYEDILQEKHEFLYGLDKLEKQGYRISRKYTMASNIDDIRYEFNKVKRQRDVDKSIKFYRKALMGITSGVEYLNDKFDPLDVKLGGWSESQMENITDYDEVFEELHDKYNESIEMAPELKLMLMVGGSAFMFHLTNTLFKSSAPSLDEVLKKNPDLMRDLSQATLNTMGGNMGVSPSNPILNMMSQGINVSSDARSNIPVGPRPDQGRDSRRMRGPTGVDDILSSLQSGGDGRRSKKSNDAIEINI